MKLVELYRIVAEEKLTEFILINDSRYLKLIEELRPPYTVTLNRLDDDLFEIRRHDEHGYCITMEVFISEAEACEKALAYARDAEKEIHNHLP